MILDRLGRKPVLGFAQLLAGVTCIAAGFMGADNLRWIQVSLIQVWRFLDLNIILDNLVIDWKVWSNC